jgi:hypothetical protein
MRDDCIVVTLLLPALKYLPASMTQRNRLGWGMMKPPSFDLYSLRSACSRGVPLLPTVEARVPLDAAIWASSVKLLRSRGEVPSMEQLMVVNILQVFFYSLSCEVKPRSLWMGCLRRLPMCQLPQCRHLNTSNVLFGCRFWRCTLWDRASDAET